MIITYLSSAVFGSFKIGMRESLMGVLSGGVIIASVAGCIDNLGACIALGAFAGVISGFWLRIVHPRINAKKIYDQIGIFGPIALNALIGGVVVAPLMFQVYYWLRIVPSTMVNLITANDSMIYQLVCAGIVIGMGLAIGLISGFICLIFRNPSDDCLF